MSYKPIIFRLGEKRITKVDALRGKPLSDDSDVVQEEFAEPLEAKKPRKRQRLLQNEDTSSSSQNLAKMGVYKAKRVSLAQDQLVEAILQAFKRKSQYRLNELVEMLNHPV